MFRAYSIGGCDGLELRDNGINIQQITAGGLMWVVVLGSSVKRTARTSFLRTGTHTSHSETQEHLNKTLYPVILANWKERCLFSAM